MLYCTRRGYSKNKMILICFSRHLQISQRQKAQRAPARVAGRGSADTRFVGTPFGCHRPTGGTGVAENPRVSGGEYDER